MGGELPHLIVFQIQHFAQVRPDHGIAESGNCDGEHYALHAFFRFRLGDLFGKCLDQ